MKTTNRTIQTVNTSVTTNRYELITSWVDDNHSFKTNKVSKMSMSKNNVLMRMSMNN